MPRPKKFDPSIEAFEESVANPVIVVNKDLPKVEEAVSIERPKIISPEWNTWVLNQLRDDEMEQNRPTVDGLRRLVEEILGEVVHSAPMEHFEGANSANAMKATVGHVVKIAWNNNLQDIRVFGALADVYPGNTDEEFARHAAATADTRAEARALRKALRLRKIIANEEATSVPVSESGLGQYIVKSQERGIDKMCRDLDINAIEFINSGKVTYKHFSLIKYITAQQMLEQLNKYLGKPTYIPDDIKGYDPDWRSIPEE